MTLDFETLTELAAISQDSAWAALLVFLRVGAALALMPAFGEQSVSPRLRLVIALAFTAVVAPAVRPALLSAPSLEAAGFEIAMGLSLGAVFRLFIFALQIAGSIIAQATSLSQITGGVAPDPLPAVGHFLTAAGLALAVMAGLHVKLAEAFILSYHLMPVGGFATSSEFAQWGTAQTARAFTLGFTLAAPFTIAALMYNLALGAINRAMPTLMVSFIGAPALSAAGLGLLAMLAPILLAFWAGELEGFMRNPFEMPR